jgi:ribosomal protein L20
LVNGLQAAGVTLNRKMLAEIAICDPAGFDAIVKLVAEPGGKAAA